MSQARPGRVISPSLCRYIELSWVSVPGGAPQLVHCDPISPSSVSISWKAPPVEMRNGIILGYLITYRLENKIGGEGDCSTTYTNLMSSDRLRYDPHQEDRRHRGHHRRPGDLHQLLREGGGLHQGGEWSEQREDDLHHGTGR